MPCGGLFYEPGFFENSILRFWGKRMNNDMALMISLQFCDGCRKKVDIRVGLSADRWGRKWNICPRCGGTGHIGKMIGYLG